MTSTAARPVIGITMGDPFGVGPEILVKALADPDLYTICRPFIIGDCSIMEKALTFSPVSMAIHSVKTPDQGLYKFQNLDILNLSALDPDIPEGPTVESGKAVETYILHATDLAIKKKMAALVTCPITKTGLKLAGSKFHGHTELIADRTGTRTFSMMLAGKTLKVVLVTIHIPLLKVPGALTVEAVLETIRLTWTSLKDRFGIQKPKLAVAGLNPHAGEDSMFGSEDEKIILPAVETAAKGGMDIKGPMPPDTVFYHAAQGRFDAVVCMYHDQGLIPFKLLHFKDGVNTTLGLPIIRTSVDHGTAYDIAWKGLADPTSLKEAIKMAVHQANVQAAMNPSR